MSTIQQSHDESPSHQTTLAYRANILLPSLTAKIGPDIEAEFAQLAEFWRCDRGTSSNVPKMILLPVYQRVIGLGPAALPLILREMTTKPDFWFAALRAITGENPVPPEHAGNLAAMTKDWLDWAHQNGYPNVPELAAPL